MNGGVGFGLVDVWCAGVVNIELERTVAVLCLRCFFLCARVWCLCLCAAGDEVAAFGDDPGVVIRAVRGGGLTALLAPAA